MAWVMQSNPDSGKKQRLYPDAMRENMGAARAAAPTPPPSAGIHANSPSLVAPNAYQQRGGINPNSYVQAPPPPSSPPNNMSDMLHGPAPIGNAGVQARPPASYGSAYVRPAVNSTNLTNFAKGTGAGLATGLATGAVNQGLLGKGLNDMQSGTSSALGDVNTTAHLAGNLIQNGAGMLPTLVGRAVGVDPGATIQSRVAQAGNVIHNFITPANQLKAENAPDAVVSAASTPNVARAPVAAAPEYHSLTPPTTEGWVPGKLLSQIRDQQAKYDTNAVAAGLAGQRLASPLDSNPAAVSAATATRAPRTVEYTPPTQAEKVNKNEAWANQILKDPYFARYQPQTVESAKTFLRSAKDFRENETKQQGVQADRDLRQSDMDYQRSRDVAGDQAAAAKAQRDEIRYQAEHADDGLKAQQVAHNDNLNQAKAYLTKEDEKGNKLGQVDTLLGVHSSLLRQKGLTDNQGRMSPEAMRTVMPQLLQALSAGASAANDWKYGPGDPAEALQSASGILGQWLSNLPDVPQTR